MGNPGLKYSNTRHNVAQWVFDSLEHHFSMSWSKKEKLFSEFCHISFKGKAGNIALVKPTVFMNESGKSVFNFCSFFKINPLEILVIHDELDLMPGVAKFKFGGRSAGHRGIENIESMLGTQNFWRLRIGIGHPKSLGISQNVSNFVLSSPRQEDKDLINLSFSMFSKNIFLFFNKKIDQVNNLLVTDSI